MILIHKLLGATHAQLRARRFTGGPFERLVCACVSNSVDLTPLNGR